MGKTFQDLRGCRLNSVEFVLDYFQLRFDDSCLTVTAPTELQVGELKACFGRPGFCDLICREIGKAITAVEVVPADRLAIVFEDSVTLKVAMGSEEQMTPEAVVLTFDDGTIIVG